MLWITISPLLRSAAIFSFNSNALPHGARIACLRSAIGSELPFYATSSVNPGGDAGAMIADLVGVRLLDLPWEVQPGHPAAMVYPRMIQAGGATGGASGPSGSLDMDRLYALGIDSFRIAREISSRPPGSFSLDGVTGNLTIDFGRGPARFKRVQRAAIYQGGGFSLIGAATR